MPANSTKYQDKLDKKPTKELTKEEREKKEKKVEKKRTIGKVVAVVVIIAWTYAILVIAASTDSGTYGVWLMTFLFS